MRPLSGLSRIILCATLAAAASGCSTPSPPAPQAEKAPEPAKPSARHVAHARPARCEQPGHPHLTDAQKVALFQEFDDWQKQRDPAAADAPVPPPSPAPKRAASRSCRVSGA